MLVENREPDISEDIILKGEGYECVGLNPDNLACFYAEKGGDLTKVFLKETALPTDMFEVQETPEEICKIVDVPTIMLNCHEDEENCDKVGLAVSNIAAYRRKEDNSLTRVFLRQRTSADIWFYVEETPEQIRDLIGEARRRQPHIS